MNTALVAIGVIALFVWLIRLPKIDGSCRLPAPVEVDYSRLEVSETGHVRERIR